MAYPGIKKTQGFDFNFFQKVTVNWTTHFGANDGYTTADGYGPDLIITFPTQGLIFSNSSGAIVEYSFNGNTIHGELATTGNRSILTFTNRVASLIWFRLQAPGTSIVSVEAWGTR